MRLTADVLLVSHLPSLLSLPSLLRCSLTVLALQRAENYLNAYGERELNLRGAPPPLLPLAC